jgi:hypothetical protein
MFSSLFDQSYSIIVANGCLSSEVPALLSKDLQYPNRIYLAMLADYTTPNLHSRLVCVHWYGELYFISMFV